MSTDIGTLLGHIGFDISRLRSAERSVSGSTNRMSSSLGLVENNARKAALAIGSLATGAGLYGMAQSAKKLVDTASDLQEVGSKFDTVFRGVKGTNNWVTELRKDFAMSEIESRKYLSSIQDLLVPMGLNRDAAAGLSREMTKLSADLGSFNNLPTAQVMENIQSAMTGEYDSMKKYGIILNETTVQQQALSMGLVKNKNDITAVHKALAAYSLMMKNSADAIGDQKKTMDSYANVSKKFSAVYQDLETELGNRLLPTATTIVSTLAEITQSLMNTDSAVHPLVADFKELMKVIGVGTALYLVPGAFAAATTAIQTARYELHLFNMAVKSGNITTALNTPLWGTSIAANSASKSLAVLKGSVASLFAAYAGFKLGSWMYKEFEVARQAGLAFVDGVLSGWYHLEYGAKSAWNAISSGWISATNTMKTTFAGFVESVGKGMDKIPFMDADKEMISYAETIKKSVATTKTYSQSQKELRADFDKTIATHKKLIDEILTESRNKQSTDILKDGGTEKKVSNAEDIAKRIADANAAILAAIKGASSQPFVDPEKAKKDAEKMITDRQQLYEGLLSRYKEVTLSQLEFKKWELSEELNLIKEKYGEGSDIYKQAALTHQAEIKNIEDEAAKNRIEKEKMVSEQRTAFLDSLKEKTIQISNDEFETRRLMLEKESEEIRKKYATDKEILDQWETLYKATLTDINNDYEKYIEKQNSKTKTLTEEFQKIGDDFKSSFSGTLTDMLFGSETTFADIATSFSKMVAEMLIKQALLKTMSYAGIMHSGGIVGSTTAMRSVDSNVFLGAPRLHNGLRDDEFPAILQRGEVVIPKDKVNSNGGSGGSTSTPQKINNDVQIFNAIDPNVIRDYLGSSSGKKAIKNVIASDSNFLRGLRRG